LASVKKPQGNADKGLDSLLQKSDAGALPSVLYSNEETLHLSRFQGACSHDFANFKPLFAGWASYVAQ
jgi:hypothetical protein